jgi:hypothetical protein
MRSPLRTSLALVLILFLVSGIFWLNKRSETQSTPQAVAKVDQTQENEISEMEMMPVDTELLHDFQAWMAQYRAGERSESFLKQGVVLAEQRRPAMLQLIQQDGAAALGAAIGYADYASLPSEMQALVEKPYSSTGDVEVIAICDHDFHTPENHVNVYLEDNQRLRMGNHSAMRTGLSKLDVPLQGIQLDGWTAVEPTVFDRVDGAGVDWAWENLPSGNPDPGLDFFTGEPLGPNPITVVAGGFAFLFSDENSLAALEAELRSYDNLPGKYTGSSVIFSEIVQEVQGKGFPIEKVGESQLQLLEDDTKGDKTSLFIRIVFPNKMDAPISKEDLEAQINTSVSGHLMDFSYNQTSMNATVTQAVYTASMNSSEYAYTGNGDSIDEKDLWDEAVDAYKDDNGGADPFNTYDIVGIVFPKIDEVGWAGLGTVGGANSKHWLNGVASTETIVHEFGHNYGLNHSNYWEFNKTNAASTNPVDPAGVGDEYGDLWDVMGDGDANRGHFHMGAKRYLSWLAANQIETINSDGSYSKRIYRFDHKDANPGLQGLEIKKANNENYWVGYRRAYESNANYYRGAYIFWERPEGASRNQGWIIDTTPESDGERQDAGISLGRTYSDTAAKVHITPVAVGGSAPNEYLDVVVNVGAFAGNNAPTISNPNIPSSGDARTPLAFSIQANDTDGGDTLAYSWDLADGQVYPSAPSINAIFPVGGNYDVTVTVSDMKGGTVKYVSQISIADPVNDWVTRTSPVGQNLNGLADNGTTLVAVGDFSILTSTDGSTWQKRDPGILNYILEDVVWTGSEFIAAGLLVNGGGFANGILSSLDGITWAEEYKGSVSQSNYLSIASNEDGSLVIAVTQDGLISVRDSEGNWSDVDFGFPANSFLGVACGNGVFVIGGHDQVNNLLILKRTADGVNFADLVDNADLPGYFWLDNMDFHNGLFFGGGFFSNIQFSENGGLSWASLVSGQLNIEAFGYGNGVYYAIGEDMADGNALVNMVSSNGKIWSFVSSESAENGNAIHFFKNTFIIVGDGGSIRQSGSVNAADEILAAPVISPAGDEFGNSINVTITTDAEDAEIRYTLNGSEPDSGSTLYENAIVLTDTTTVKAKVFKSGLDPSPAASATYTKVLSAYDTWIGQFNLEGVNTTPGVNPDGDWASNLFERAVGSEPDDIDSAPDAPELSFNAQGKAVFKIHRLSKSADVTISIEKSVNLKDWELLETTATMDTETLLELTSNAVISTYPCFLQVKAIE